MVCFSVTWMISCAEHAGELRFVLDQRQRAARDVDVAAGRGERVDAVGVEHDEGPRQARTRAALRQRQADQADVAVHAGVLHHAVARANPLADLLAELLLFGVGHLQVADVVRLLGDRQALADAARQLSRLAARSRARPERKPAIAMQSDVTHHVDLTSKIATGLLLPFTMTSPRGWIS